MQRLYVTFCVLFFILQVMLFNSAGAQAVTNSSYPKTYFTRPLNIPVSLAGNFGDLRTNHYHMGLDFRTQQKENLPVLAAAEGYVSRIKIEPYGYGRAIYITHPNGLVTLYAHLNNFFSSLENYVRQQQYATQKWQQDIDIPAQLFPVKKGQFIAYSGNTGGSEGPHLHFEIRDAKTGNNYNPLLFGLGIADNIPPSVYRLVLYDRNSSIYTTEPAFIKIKKQQLRNKALDNQYVTSDAIVKVPMGKFSFGISAEDKTNGSFMFGIYGATLLLDSVITFEYHIDNFSYDDSRYINAGIDYGTRIKGGSYIHHLSKLPGNRIPVFDTKAGDGTLQLQDDSVHAVQILVKDANGNLSQLQLKIQRDTTTAAAPAATQTDLQILQPGKEEWIVKDDIKMQLSSYSLYDTVYLAYSNQPRSLPYVSAIHKLADYRFPVHDSVMVSIRANPNTPIAVREKTVMILRSGNKTDVQKGTWNGDWLEAKWRNFGAFMLWRDTIKPVITPVNIYDSAVFVKDQKLVFNATDETGDLQLLKGFIDGKWVIFKQKKDTYTYEFDDRCTQGWHTVTVTATDAAGNLRDYTCSFHNGKIPPPETAETEQ